MEIQAEGIIKREDFVTAQNHLVKVAKKELKNKHSKMFSLFPILLIAFCIGFIIRYFNIGPKIEYRTAFIVIGFAAAVFLIAIKYFKKSVYGLASDTSIYFGKHIYIVKEEGLLEETEKKSELIKWTGVLDIEESKDMIFVYVDTIVAHFIPKHFFANETDANNFKMAIIDKCKHLRDVP